MCAATILGGEKQDLLEDDVREIVDAVHRRFYRFLRSGWGGGSPLLLAPPGAGSTTGVAVGGSLIFLVLGPTDSIFLAGVALSSRV